MTSISDILQWVKKLFTDHNEYTNANSHAAGFNHPLYLYPQDHGNPSYDSTEPREASLVFITSDNIPQVGNQNKTSFGSITFRANNVGAKIIPRLTIDYDEVVDATNNQRRQMLEYHFCGYSSFVGGRIVCIEPASVAETTSSNSYCKIALLCEDHAFHNVLTTYDLSTSSMMGFPDYANAGAINTSFVYAANKQTTTKKCYLAIVARGGSSDAYYNFTLNINGKNINAGLIQSESHWYKSGGGATILPLEKGTTWYISNPTSNMQSVWWQYIPMK